VDARAGRLTDARDGGIADRGGRRADLGLGDARRGDEPDRDDHLRRVRPGRPDVLDLAPPVDGDGHGERDLHVGVVRSGGRRRLHVVASYGGDAGNAAGPTSCTDPNASVSVVGKPASTSFGSISPVVALDTPRSTSPSRRP